MIRFSLDKFSSPYRALLSQAVSLALELNTREVGPDFLLLTLLDQRESNAGRLLPGNISGKQLKQKLFNKKRPIELTPFLNEETMQIVDVSAMIATECQSKYVGTEHLLLALLRSNFQMVQAAFKLLRLNRTKLEKNLSETVNQNKTNKAETGSEKQTPNPNNQMDTLPDFVMDDFPGPWEREKKYTLESFAKELTAADCELSPISCRETEMAELCTILLRKEKNNPLLIGEPGVGKTAMAQGLAWLIRAQKAPGPLLNKRVFSLNLSSLIAGTIYRGEFESRMKELLADITKRNDVILFIDEIHMIVGAGSAQGSVDLANLLKPALARGEIHCIGATTSIEYRKHLKSDGALDRRFQLLNISEPSEEQAVKILRDTRTNYEKHHQVSISDEALKAAVRLSSAYITSRSLPDKAFDLIDQAGAAAALICAPDPLLGRVRSIKNKLKELETRHENLLYQEMTTEANSIGLEIETIKKEVSGIELTLNQNKAPSALIDVREIALIVQEKTGIPLETLMRSGFEKIESIKAELGKTIIGQEAALEKIHQAIKRAHLALTQRPGPITTLLFLGPSGVGKTQTARLLSEKLYARPEAFIKIDMSEFTERHTISKLIGSPAGYVGYKEDPSMLEAVARTPANVLLFDEIEKAHPDILNLLLQIIDDGQVTLSSGIKINFSQSIIILTSNIGTRENNSKIGFDKSAHAEDFSGLLNKHFRPELINRLDDIIVFKPLGAQELTLIIENQIEKLNRACQERSCTLKIGDNVAKHLAGLAEKEGGVRATQKIIREKLENQLTDHFMKTNPSKLSVRLNKEKQVVITNF